MTDASASATMQAQKSLNFDFHEQVKEVFFQKNGFYQLAMHFVYGQLALRSVCIHVLYLHIPTYHVHNDYVTYIVAMQPYFSRLLLLYYL